MSKFLDSLSDDLAYLITKHLAANLEDALSLISTCRTLRTYYDSRSFFLAALDAAKRLGSHPLPCSPHQDLTALSIEELRGIALHDMRLQRTWGQPECHPVSVVHAKESASGHQILYVLPGVRHVVTFKRAEGTLVCWNMATGRPIASLHDTHFDLDSASEPYHGDGMTLFANMQREGGDNASDLVVYRVDYATPEAPRLAEIFRRTLPDIRSNSVTFVGRDIAGTVVHHNTRVYSLNLADGEDSGIKSRDINSGAIRSACILREDGLDIYEANPRERFTAHRIPNTSLPHCSTDVGDEPRVTRLTPWPLPEQGGGYVLPQDDAYGVHLVSICRVSGRLTSNYLAFWPARPDPLPSCEGEQTALRECVHTWPDPAGSVSRFVVGGSGRNALSWRERILSYGTRGALALGTNHAQSMQLIRYSESPPRASAHRVKVHKEWWAQGPLSVGLDDHLGIVYIVKEGEFCAISYA